MADDNEHIGMASGFRLSGLAGQGSELSEGGPSSPARSLNYLLVAAIVHIFDRHACSAPKHGKP